jgi:starch phosphorylase
MTHLRRAIDLIASGHFTDGDRSPSAPIVGDLLYNDRFLVLADFESYLEAQARVDAAYGDQDAGHALGDPQRRPVGFFSSDRSMRDYIDRIWHVKTGV